MYFQIRDFVRGCPACLEQRNKRPKVRDGTIEHPDVEALILNDVFTMSFSPPCLCHSCFALFHTSFSHILFPSIPFSPSFSHYWWLCSTLARVNSLSLLQKRVGERRLSQTMMSHSRDMLSKLRSQREAGLFCDITLRTDGCSYSAHKAVLAAVSEYFQELFTEMDSAPSSRSDIDLTGTRLTHTLLNGVLTLSFCLCFPPSTLLSPFVDVHVLAWTWPLLLWKGT